MEGGIDREDSLRLFAIGNGTRIINGLAGIGFGTNAGMIPGQGNWLAAFWLDAMHKGNEAAGKWPKEPLESGKLVDGRFLVGHHPRASPGNWWPRRNILWPS